MSCCVVVQHQRDYQSTTAPHLPTWCGAVRQDHPRTSAHTTDLRRGGVVLVSVPRLNLTIQHMLAPQMMVTMSDDFDEDDDDHDHDHGHGRPR